MILVPVKNLSSAKQRLAAVLDQPSRTQLAQAMLFDVLETLFNWSGRPGVCVVSGDSYALRLAGQFRFDVIPDKNNASETDAIEVATQICEARGIRSTMVIPGDIPLVEAGELEQIYASAPAEGTVLVPGADGRGTNAVLRNPSSLFPLRFGNDSFQPHLEAAQATNKACVVLSLPGIGLDIDNPSDLFELVRRPGERRAQQLARQWNLGELPRAANQ